MDRLEPDEVLFVMGHEIGHFVLRHTLTVILGATLLATLSLFVVHRVAGRLIARFHRRFGFDRLDDVASLPLLVLVGGVVMLATTPAALALSRWQEREADRFGLEITRDNQAAARAFVRLQRREPRRAAHRARLPAVARQPSGSGRPDRVLQSLSPWSRAAIRSATATASARRNR